MQFTIQKSVAGTQQTRADALYQTPEFIVLSLEVLSQNETILDLTAREKFILVPMVVLTIVLGVYPDLVFDITSASVAHLVELHDAGVQRAALDVAQFAEVLP